MIQIRRYTAEKDGIFAVIPKNLLLIYVESVL